MQLGERDRREEATDDGGRVCKRLLRRCRSSAISSNCAISAFKASLSCERHLFKNMMFLCRVSDILGRGRNRLAQAIHTRNILLAKQARLGIGCRLRGTLEFWGVDEINSGLFLKRAWQNLNVAWKSFY